MPRDLKGNVNSQSAPDKWRPEKYLTLIGMLDYINITDKINNLLCGNASNSKVQHRS